MKRRASRGVSAIEFAFSSLVLVPTFLGTVSIGINMIKTLQTVQLARDAGHMYGRGVDFSLAGNQDILAHIGWDLGLSTTAGQGNAVVIFSALTYVDDPTCVAANAADGNGVHTGACTNWSKWVFTQRLVVGNSTVRSSNWGAPSGVPMDPTTGKIATVDYAKNAGAVVTFSGVNPYSVVNNVAQGLPSRQMLYLSEASATGFRMPPFSSGAPTYSFGFF